MNYMKHARIIIYALCFCIAAYCCLRFIPFSEKSAITISPLEAKQFLLDNQLIDDNDLSKGSDKVQRITYLKNLLSIIGTSRITGDITDLVSVPYTPSFADFTGDDDWMYIELAARSYVNETNKDKEYVHNPILYGKWGLDLEDGFRLVKKAKPYQSISVKDAVALTSRCLTQSTPNSNHSYFQALHIGLISKYDQFYSLSGKNKLTYDDMYILLYRLANQPMHKYIDNFEHKPGASLDCFTLLNSDTTYLQYRQTGEY